MKNGRPLRVALFSFIFRFCLCGGYLRHLFHRTAALRFGDTGTRTAGLHGSAAGFRSGRLHSPFSHKNYTAT
jgi:hypothetical protein